MFLVRKNILQGSQSLRHDQREGLDLMEICYCPLIVWEAIVRAPV